MKKILVLILAAMLTACGGTPSGSTPAAAAPAKESYVELSENLAIEEYGIGFRKQDVAFGLEVQRILEEMIADGTAGKISEKWFGSDVLFRDGKFLTVSEAPADDKSLEAIKAKGKIVMGLDDSYPPMGFRNEKNEIVGLDIDLANEVAKRMGVTLELQPIDWDSKEMELNSGKIDCIWNGMTITPERIENMFIPKAYMPQEQIIIVAASSGITEKAQLEGKIVGLQKGSSALDALNGDPISAKVKQVVEYPDNVAAYMDLKAGRIDVFVVDSTLGRYVMAQNDK